MYLFDTLSVLTVFLFIYVPILPSQLILRRGKSLAGPMLVKISPSD